MATKKQIVYLLGTGASQGELTQNNATKGILMQDIVDGISLKIRRDNMTQLFDVNNELSIEGIDAEHLITLYEASGTKKHNEVAKQLKKLFREEIEERIGELDQMFSPTLFASLIDMHSIDGLHEELVAILTINYEDLIERAMQQVKGGVNYLIKTVNRHSSYCVGEDCIPVLKLHGSFNWKNEYPVAIEKDIEDEEDVLWIPPGVVKRREYYPFSLIWGRAKELLDCDILRIIGCSLSRNDWELVSMLYTTQKLRTDGRSYIIELIVPPSIGEGIRNDYKYLNMRTILDIDLVRDYLIREHFPSHVGRPITEEILDELRQGITPEKYNVFAIWLRAIGEKLLEEGIPIKTNSNIFENFIRKAG